MPHLASIGICAMQLHGLWVQSHTHLTVVVITLAGAVPVMGSIVSKLWYTAASCFFIKLYLTSAPFHSCDQNPMGWHVHLSLCQRPHT